MRRKRQPQQRKLRTREHVLADLSVNHVERQVLLCNFAVSRIEKDYGLDLMMTTYNELGEVENGFVLFQLKATDTLQLIHQGKTISFRVEVADLQAWQHELMPVILILYDGQKDKAYWLYVQQYLDEEEIDLEALVKEQDRLTVHLPTNNRVNRKAVEKFRQYRHRIVEQTQGTIRHGEE